MTLDPVLQDRQQLLHQEIRGADIDGEKRVEILDGRFLDRRSPGNPGIGDQDVQAVTDDLPRLGGELYAGLADRTGRRRWLPPGRLRP